MPRAVQINSGVTCVTCMSLTVLVTWTFTCGYERQAQLSMLEGEPVGGLVYLEKS